MKLLKQVVGIDVSSESLSISVGTIDQAQTITISHRLTHANTPSGFAKLAANVEKHRAQLLAEHELESDELPLWFVMEASGVYYERLALWLVEHGHRVTVALPNSVKAHAKSDNRKSKNDRIDADAIAHYGLEKSLNPWQPLAPTIAKLKSLVREQLTVIEELTSTKNRMHALETSASDHKHSLKRLRQLRDLLKKQLKQIEQEIKELINSDPELKKDAEFLDSAPSIGILTAAVVLAETNRFQLVERAEQLVSYVGIDPVMHQSGKHNGTVRISRKGNSVLRHALFMPALTAIRCIPSMRALHLRIVAKTGIKMKGVVAVMRKLLTLMYTLWKKQEHFNPELAAAPAAA